MKAKLFLFFIFVFYSCEKVNCVKLAEIYRENSCKIIVEDLPIAKSGHNFYIVGKTISTQKDTVYDEENRWFCQFYRYIEKGDTIKKEKGETIFNIHKKDTILTFYFECNGKIYK